MINTILYRLNTFPIIYFIISYLKCISLFTIITFIKRISIRFTIFYYLTRRNYQIIILICRKISWITSTTKYQRSLLSLIKYLIWIYNTNTTIINQILLKFRTIFEITLILIIILIF